MQSTQEHPFKFFDWYLKEEIKKDLDNFYSNAISEELNIYSINKEKHIIEILNSESQVEYYSFENSIKNKINSQVQKTKDFIELGFEKRFSNKKEVKGYAEFLKAKINQFLYFKNIKEFSFLENSLKEISQFIDYYLKPANINFQHNYSFNIISESPEKQVIIIEKLYTLLTENPPLIQCNKSDFINSLTGREVKNGIYWLIVGKNKFVSKTSLFYFIEELVKKKYLKSSIITDLSKYIEYVFRDNNGDKFINLKQSKSTVSKNVTSKDKIDLIISSI